MLHSSLVITCGFAAVELPGLLPVGALLPPVGTLEPLLSGLPSDAALGLSPALAGLLPAVQTEIQHEVIGPSSV